MNSASLKAKEVARVEELRLKLANDLALAQAKQKDKSAKAGAKNPEKEALDLLKEQAKIQKEIFDARKLLTTASGEDKKTLEQQ